MGQRLIISENERSRISQMYGLVNESDDFKENSVLIFRDTESSPIPRLVSINLKTKPSRHYVNGKDMNEVVFEWSYKSNEPSWGPQKYGKFNCIKEYVHLPEVSDVAETHGKIVRDDMLVMMKNYCKKYTGPTEKEGELVP